MQQNTIFHENICDCKFFWIFEGGCLGIIYVAILYQQMATELDKKPTKSFNCDLCDYICSNKKDFNKHLMTRKHQVATNLQQNCPQKSLYKCDSCEKEYQDRTGLWRHKKKCTYTSTPPLENTIVYATEEKPQPTTEPGSGELIVLVKELMLQLTAKDKQLEELQNTVKELIPHLGNNNTSNSNNNNTTFNVQLYLENECKDALSIQEFVKRIEINMNHLKTIAKDGYVDSVSNILIKALNNMDITERPLHCTDLKRETVYIKNNETWNKSTADEPIMNQVINTIENKHYAVVKHYVQTTPAARELDTPEYNFYAKACVQALGNYEDHDKLNKKIYKKVLPEIKLDKSVIK